MEFYRAEFKAMGTPCDIQLFAKTQTQAKQVADAAIADIQRLEIRYSRYRPDSFLAAINRVAALGGSIEVDAETGGLLDYAVACHEQSEGLFDITSGILRQAWRFDLGKLPDEETIQNLLGKIGWHKVHWQSPLLEFTVAGMEIDFGGIVKEYAVDRAAALCRSQGINHGVVNLGGDIKIIGPRTDGSPWRIGIRHPRQQNALLDTVSLHHGALASSGDYERCILIDGVRYGHILNPKTGWPVKYLAAVSVVSDFCVIAGSASTIAMLKEDQGPEWLDSLGLPHYWFDVEGRAGGSLFAA
ncbi:MAG: FAD:protein FMN transferase [Methylovulum sp.]|uniref:FAD:protein FMN transferase n=1 Tax=Methylovulum sp. TaxID=1916980 RepID=UPI00261CD395|nr:FAD:protein FMN transferase [Methylovulum sp.]MDD2723022.1 FAD:protein FMN transferase [Methylovulum sp.]MDD5124764.1 FAD:protein FMN transferase [Methylovulum sp.]